MKLDATRWNALGVLHDEFRGVRLWPINLSPWYPTGSTLHSATHGILTMTVHMTHAHKMFMAFTEPCETTGHAHA